MIGPILKELAKILLKNKNAIQKTGQEAVKFYGKHHVAINRGIRIAAIAFIQYNTYRAQQYEKKLQEQYAKYKQDTNEQFKVAAKNILNEIDGVIDSQDISEDEKRELKDILRRHADWVNS